MNEQKITSFMEITGMEDKDLASAMLASVDFDVERAVEQHFSVESHNDDDDVIMMDESRPSNPTDRNRNDSSSVASDNEVIIDDVEERAPEIAPRVARPYHSETHIIERPVSSRVLRSRVVPQRPPQPQLIDCDSDDDYHDAQHGYVDDVEDATEEPVLPLVPTDFGTVRDAVQNFASVFDARYRCNGITSRPAPNFYNGELNEAVREAFDPIGRGAAERRPLALYIHHDKSVAANIFPRNVLLSEPVSHLLRCQFILWPWDITARENLDHLRTWLSAVQWRDIGAVLEIRGRNNDNFPCLALIIKDKGVLSLHELVSGTDGVESTVAKLMSTLESYEQIRLASMADEAERQERNKLREEQLKEYNESLAADRARAEAREREIREQKEAEERKLREQEEENLRREALASSLPPEPDAKEPNLIHIKFRTPSGEPVCFNRPMRHFVKLLRRFRASEPYSTLLNFLSSKGYEPSKYKYFNSDFPKKEVDFYNGHFSFVKVTNLSSTESFANLKFPAREQIFVEEI